MIFTLKGNQYGISRSHGIYRHHVKGRGTIHKYIVVIPPYLFDLVTKDIFPVSDINKFYAYATYEKIDATKVKAKVQDFGVVVDKKGTFGIDGVSTSDKKLNVDKGLRIGKGFIEGHNNKAPDAVLAAEEYGAKISPKDTVTGVWVRPYVNLGGGLVVYGTPEYYQSVSKYYAGNTYNDANVWSDGNITLASTAGAAGETIVGQILKAHNVGVAAGATATPEIVGLNGMYNAAQQVNPGMTPRMNAAQPANPGMNSVQGQNPAMGTRISGFAHRKMEGQGLYTALSVIFSVAIAVAVALIFIKLFPDLYYEKKQVGGKIVKTSTISGGFLVGAIAGAFYGFFYMFIQISGDLRE